MANTLLLLCKTIIKFNKSIAKYVEYCIMLLLKIKGGIIMFCKQCGSPIEDGQELCENCKANGANSNAGTTQNINVNVNSGNTNTNPNAKSKIAAGLLGIFLGCFGVHNFYLGFTGKAIAQLLITILSCGMLSFASAIWGLIEGILILTGSMNTDAQGNPLKD